METRFDRYRNYDKNIDLLFLGNSLTGDAIDKETADKKTGLNSFVYNHQGTNPETVYYLLLDVAAKHNMKEVICDWDIIQIFRDPPYHYPHSEELYREFFVNSMNNKKLYFLTLKNILKQRYTSTFFKYSSFPENITEIPAVIKSHLEKKEPPRGNGLPPEPRPENYIPKDYKDVVIENSYSNVIQDNDILYISLIRDFCNINSIKLTVVSYPVPDCVEKALPEMKDYRKHSAQLFETLGINYIDATEIPGVTKDQNFNDAYGHFFTDCKEMFTEKLFETIKGKENS